MATITKIKGKFKVQIRRKGYPAITKRFHDLKDARKFARTVESEMERGVFENYAGARGTTLREILVKYRDEKTIKIILQQNWVKNMYRSTTTVRLDD